MSVGRGIRAFTALGLSLLSSTLGWVLLAPIAALVPKRRDSITVIGRQDGKFLDNAKYFFLQASQLVAGCHATYVTGQSDVAKLIASGGLAAVRYPGWSAIWVLLRSGTTVVDSVEWQRRWLRFLTMRSHVVQLWHGVGAKRIEKDRWRHETGGVAWASAPLAFRARLLVYAITGRLLRYAAVVTTSRFYRDEVFVRSLSAVYFPVTGYPRNDFAQSLRGPYKALAWSNVDGGVRTQLHGWVSAGIKLVIIAPTFRDSGAVPMQLDDATLRTIDAFAAHNGVEFVFKFHPSERNVDHIAGQHFHVCARDSDIYPVLPHASALVTDYSSISTDFLLVDRPVLFLIPKNDTYTTRDRELQFNPRAMMPGPIVADWPSLLQALLDQWAHDTYTQDRAALRRKAFDDLPQSEAVPKLIALMRERGWLRCARVGSRPAA